MSRDDATVALEELAEVQVSHFVPCDDRPTDVVIFYVCN
jgi:hypothetical protein